MYDTSPDPYCYPGSRVLQNIAGIRDARNLERFEAMVTHQRSWERPPLGKFGVTHYRAIHRHLFQDVYRWAGHFRTVRIEKGGSMFCFPENIDSQMRRVFKELRQNNLLRSKPADEFAVGVAHFLAELNAIHPFREGNGRAQNVFSSCWLTKLDTISIASISAHLPS